MIEVGTPEEGGDVRSPSVYATLPSGAIVLYGGDMEIEVGGATLTHHAQVELRDGVGGPLVVHAAGRDIRLLELQDLPRESFRLPAAADLTPPSDTTLPPSPSEGGWVDVSVVVNQLEHGDPERAERFVLHVTGEFGPLHPRAAADDPSFELGGWQVALDDLPEHGVRDFACAAQCIPSGSSTGESVRTTAQRLAMLLSLIAGTEIGIGPIAGFADSGEICYVHWAAGRAGSAPGVLWCPTHLVADALPALSDGLSAISNDPVMERVVQRAIGFMCAAATSREVLDIRVPIACSGLELLSWALLQRRGWLSSQALNSLSAGARFRLLMQSCSIPPDLPSEMSALRGRAERLGQLDWSGAEIVANVRNAVVHAPKRLDAPEWPTADELLEAWQFSTWTLELSILHLLGYSGEYWSRLRLGRSVWETEPVPWMT